MRVGLAGVGVLLLGHFHLLIVSPKRSRVIQRQQGHQLKGRVRTGHRGYT